MNNCGYDLKYKKQISIQPQRKSREFLKEFQNITKNKSIDYAIENQPHKKIMNYFNNQIEFCCIK